MISFATMLFWFDVVRLQLVSAKKETVPTQTRVLYHWLTFLENAV